MDDAVRVAVRAGGTQRGRRVEHVAIRGNDDDEKIDAMTHPTPPASGAVQMRELTLREQELMHAALRRSSKVVHKATATNPHAEQIAALTEATGALRDALEESLALNINWSSDAEPETLAYYSEYKAVIKQAEAALARIDATKGGEGEG